MNKYRRRIYDEKCEECMMMMNENTGCEGRVIKTDEDEADLMRKDEG
jgi:hypothetical protein